MLASTFNTMAAAIVFIWAIWCIFCRNVDDGVIGKVILSFVSLACYAAMMGNETSIHAAFWGVAALQVRQAWLRRVWPWIKPHMRKCKECKEIRQ